MPRFDPNVNNILYQGDAVPSVGAVEMNNKYTYFCHVGWATYAERVPLWDPDTGKLSDFSTHFSFVIDTQNRSSYGNGLAFFLAPVEFQIPPNSAGGFSGLFNTTTAYSSSNQIVMVEFDSFSNPEWDPSDVKDHVGINNNSISSAVYTRWNASSHSGDIADAWITYNATTKNLSVSWSYRTTPNSQENTHLFYKIDLMKVLPEWVTIGFSAATGVNLERHILQSWEFNSTLDKMDTSNGKEKSKIKIIVVVTVSVSVLVAGVIIISLLVLKRRKLQITRNVPTQTTKVMTSLNNNLERRAGPRRGYLIDLDMVVAVKKISTASKQGKKEYITEVKTISQLRHRNLVQLIGWSHDDKGELVLGADKRLNMEFDEKQIECLMIVGLWCAHPDYNFRPSIRQAIQVLNFEIGIPNLPSKMPVPMYHVPLGPTPASMSSGEPAILTNSSCIEVGR
ncbi:hypothetical protein Patl1_28381 [Pistacia atlantica]|uniref:Uncharacterized protein n=1 Tax=Pistacia atlantica TaxID=434234 RepID=A0ACC1BD92_9ROSI|nr:hypothetical protein Patl1_28381 [Pistacia atlantica]